MTVDEIKAAHLAYWKHTESCWQVCVPPLSDGPGCPAHRELYDAWQAALMGCSGVYVNEASIRATGQGQVWWGDFLKYRSYSILQLAPAEWFAMCDSEQDARLLELEMAEAGLPKGAAKVKTFGQCQHLRRP